MTGEPALRTTGLGRRYHRRTWALRDCDLELPQGRIIGLVGANGAGKTTLLHLAIGLLKPTEGTVSMFGRPIRMDQPDGLAQVGFVAQDHPLYRGFTVADMIRFGRSLNPRFDHAGAGRRLRDLDIPLGHKTGALSGGQQAQVALTLALAKQPRLLVPDEPVASLDPLARRDDGVIQNSWVDGAGRRLTDGEEAALLRQAYGGGEALYSSDARVERFMIDHGLRHYTEYHPDSSFWTFQAIESLGFVTLAAVLLTAAVWIVRRS
jgi:ABC-type branched-subunit amino acid transport system ATPase component